MSTLLVEGWCMWCLCPPMPRCWQWGHCRGTLVRRWQWLPRAGHNWHQIEPTASICQTGGSSGKIYSKKSENCTGSEDCGVKKWGIVPWAQISKKVKEILRYWDSPYSPWRPRWSSYFPSAHMGVQIGAGSSWRTAAHGENPCWSRGKIYGGAALGWP